MERIHTYTKEEILARIGIRLDKEWDIFLTKFTEGTRDVHKEECAYLLAEFNSEVECTCTPEVIPIIFARILGYGEKYYECRIIEDKAEIPEEGCWNLPYEAILEVPILAEDLENALTTTVEMLKAYEVSGNTDYDFFTLKLADGQVLEGKELSRVIYS